MTILQRPDELHGAEVARFKFTANEEVAEFSCSVVLTGADPNFSQCGKSDEGSAEFRLDDGNYTFQVRAKDFAGNPGYSIEFPFLVDTSPPQVTMVEYEKATMRTNVSISFEVLDGDGSGVALSNISCLLRNESRDVQAEWVPGCESPAVYVLDEGKYVFNIRAVDRAGLITESQDYILVVDQTPPTTKITQSPSEAPQPSYVAFRFTGEDNPLASASGVDSYECLLTRIIPDPATDDSTAADIRNKELDPVNRNNSVQALQSVEDGKPTSGIEIVNGPSVDLDAWVACENPIILKGMPSGSYEFRARAIDEAGNTGNASNPALFTVDAALPIPGDQASDSGSPAPLWIIIAVVGAAFAVAVVVLIIIIRLRRRNNRNQQIQHHHYTQGYGRSHPAVAQNNVNDLSSGSSEDVLLQAAIRENNMANQRNLHLQNDFENRLEAALQASRENASTAHQSPGQNQSQNDNERSLGPALQSSHGAVSRPRQSAQDYQQQLEAALVASREEYEYNEAVKRSLQTQQQSFENATSPQEMQPSLGNAPTAPPYQSGWQGGQSSTDPQWPPASNFPSWAYQ